MAGPAQRFSLAAQSTQIFLFLRDQTPPSAPKLIFTSPKKAFWLMRGGLFPAQLHPPSSGEVTELSQCSQFGFGQGDESQLSQSRVPEPLA